MESKKAGRFITFEGGEGTGKSTQIQLLKTWLDRKGIPVITTREPGGTPEGEEIRNLLVQGDPGRWDGLSEALMMFASRRRLVESLIRPTLEQGTWVLSDRFSESSWVYQGYAGKLGTDRIEVLENWVLEGLRPDLTIVFDLDPEEGLRRTHKRRHSDDRFEKKGLAFHQKLHEGYRLLVKERPRQCVLIPVEGDKEHIFKELKTVVMERFHIG